MDVLELDVGDLDLTDATLSIIVGETRELSIVTTDNDLVEVTSSTPEILVGETVEDDGTLAVIPGEVVELEVLTTVETATFELGLGIIGPQGDVGPVGPAGPIGPPGRTSGAVVFAQPNPSTVWHIVHGGGVDPSVVVKRSDGVVIAGFGRIYADDSNTVDLYFAQPMSGVATLNF